jgi:calcineurin-like phosphoesterase family protein
VTRYLLADTHFGDPDVLTYTGRPFGSVAEMNDALLAGWNDAVDADDTVVFVGDFTVPSEPTTVRRWLNRLRGELVFVAGDHDGGARRTRAVEVHASYPLEVGDRTLHCVHDPADAPPDHDGWVVHGHHHDVRPDAYPFVDPHARRVNVGVELLDYRPIPLGELLGYLDRGDRLVERSRQNG